MSARLRHALALRDRRRVMRHDTVVLLGPQMVEITFHRRIVLFERPRKMMTAVTGTGRNEIDFPALLRMHGCQNGFAPRQGNRSWRQPRPSIRVVRRISGEVA